MLWVPGPHPLRGFLPPAPTPYGSPPLPCVESGNLRRGLYGDGDGGSYAFDSTDDEDDDGNDDVEHDVKKMI